MTEDKKLSEFETLNIDPLIATNPLAKRDISKLLVINRKKKNIEHKIFKDIINYIEKDDCIVLNETKVVKNRILYKTEQGKEKDILLVKKIDKKGTTWVCLSKKIKSNEKLEIEGGIKMKEAQKNEDGSYTIYFSSPITEDYISKFGRIPLPNYIIKKRKEKNINQNEQDEKNYQTIYAKENGSIAAPTAGFHFTEELLNEISKKGAKIVKIVLHIGWGTFKMVRDNPDSFVMPAEKCYVSEKAAKEINETKKKTRRIFAVGTSSMRTIEKMSDKNGKVMPGETESDIFIKPGYKFKVADCFITNLHVPDSPPLYMTAAFADRELLFKAYTEAVNKKYRFYSYGDACLII